MLHFEEDDPGFEVGQLIRIDGASWRIIGIRPGDHGVWLELAPVR